MNGLTISDTTIHQDDEGRYSLNDLHRAAGGNKKHAPNEWLRNKQTIELVEELAKPGIPGLRDTLTPEMALGPTKIVKGGSAPGTYVVKELVYAYATWISPAFHLKVIRAYDALVTSGAQQLQPITATLQDQTFFADAVARILRLSETSKIRMLTTVAKNCGVPTNILPQYTDEKLTRALGDLLKDHGVDLSTVRANPMLEQLGFLERKERRAAHGGTKEFWSITALGERYGKNETCHQSPNQTQPRWYVETFQALLHELRDIMLIENLTEKLDARRRRKAD